MSAEKSVVKLANCDWYKSTKYLVLINYYHGDIAWRTRLNFPFIIYSKETPEREPYNAENKAKSETNLLKFIYEFYDMLPENVINVHQYEFKDYSHNGSIVDILNDSQFEYHYAKSDTRGFWNFCSYILGHAAPQVERMKQCGWWRNCMQPWFGEIDMYYNFTLNKRGCAQFVVSRDRIRSLPREFYRNMYDWLVQHSTGPPRGIDGLDEPTSNFYTSRYLEWTWELIFTVHKRTENVWQPIDSSQNVLVRGLYGAGNYEINVTNRLLKACLDHTGKRLVIPASFSFNRLFGDPLSNTEKRLRISVVFANAGPSFERVIEETHETQQISLIEP
jgi:hypothetical protein